MLLEIVHVKELNLVHFHMQVDPLRELLGFRLLWWSEISAPKGVNYIGAQCHFTTDTVY